VHAYDRRLAVRTALLAAVLALLALGVVLATDEPFSTPGMRAARMSALAPAIGALAIATALGRARALGELRALAALGSGPLRAALGPLVAGWALGALATALVVSPLADLSALFPSVSAPTLWLFDGAWRAPATGVTVAPTGALSLGAPLVADPIFAGPPGRAAAALAVGPLSLVAPIWAASPASLPIRALGAALAAALAVFLLHAVAARIVPAAALVIAALPLALSALKGLR
jgi:hypothetical protein